MKRILIFGVIILTFIFTVSCNAPSVPDNNKNPVTPTPEIKEPEVQKDELGERAASLLEEMTLEEKIGQLLIVGFPEGTDTEALQDYFDKYKVSGFILFKRNYKNFDSMYTLVKTLKEKNSLSNPLPLFVSLDEEGGTVSRLPKGGTHFPDARLIGKAKDPKLTYISGEVIGEELRASGINLNYAPILDIVSSSENKLLIKRSYGSTPEEVSLHGTAFIEGLQSKGIIAAPKHFPGHGSTTVDSHGKLPIINIDKSTLENRELVPFRSAIDNDLDALMVGHLAFPKLDTSGQPATMSAYFLTDLLRKELGFEGIAISDEIEMLGYLNGKSTMETSIVASFNAGLDVFVIGHTKKLQIRVFEALKAGVAEGSISPERLNESVLRIIKVKLKHELTDTMKYSLEEAKASFGSEAHKTVLEELNKAIK